MTNENEIWKPVVGYEDTAMISNLGNVKTIERKVMYTNGSGQFIVNKKPQELKISHRGKGQYFFARFTRNGITKGISIHRLMAMAFIPNPENKKHVNHIDGNKDNNTLANLEWSTPSENQKHAYSIGLRKYPARAMLGKRNELSPNAKPLLQIDIDSQIVVRRWPCAAEVNRECGFDPSAILKAAKGKIRKAYGFVWRYESIKKES